MSVVPVADFFATLQLCGSNVHSQWVTGYISKEQVRNRKASGI